MAEGLAGGEGFAVDASLIKADANKQRSVPGGSVEDIPANATRAVKDYLARLDDAAFGAASGVIPKFVTVRSGGPVDRRGSGGPAFFACTLPLDKIH